MRSFLLRFNNYHYTLLRNSVNSFLTIFFAQILCPLLTGITAILAPTHGYKRFAAHLATLVFNAARFGKFAPRLTT